MKRTIIIAGLILAGAVAAFLSPFSSSLPDGLERVAADRGFARAARQSSLLPSAIIDYQMPGIPDKRIATAAAGLFGIAACFGAAYLLGVLKKKKKILP
jgi:cobalt/nickel transport protein